MLLQVHATHALAAASQWKPGKQFAQYEVHVLAVQFTPPCACAFDVAGVPPVQPHAVHAPSPTLLKYLPSSQLAQYEVFVPAVQAPAVTPPPVARATASEPAVAPPAQVHAVQVPPSVSAVVSL